MKENEKVSAPAAPAAVFTPFWPLLFLAISLAVFLTWQVVAAVQQYTLAIRVSDQMLLRAEQAAQVEAKFQGMMMELLKRSATDPDAKAIITKYGVKYNAPTSTQPSLPPEAVLPPPKKATSSPAPGKNAPVVPGGP